MTLIVSDNSPLNLLVRLGLADLTATTAAGGERLVAPNIPLELAADLADRATPGMLQDLLA